MDKQPGLKAGLREFVLKKAGNKARQTGFLDLFGEDPGQGQQQQQAPFNQGTSGWEGLLWGGSSFY